VEFDYVVVGAGAAGCAVARRLSDHPGTTVLLVEYGGRARNPLLHIPKGFYYTLRDRRYLYRYETKNHEVWIRGRVTGGSTAVNGTMWMRGAAADWDGLAARGNPGWAWRDILPVYKELEDHSLGAGDTRGAGGPVGVTITKTANPVTAAILESAKNYGWAHAADMNSGDEERIGYTPSTIRRGIRVSAYSMVGRSANRSNITVATRTRAECLLFSGERVTGVRVRRGAAVTDVAARREVIVSAGTIETPLLLERSGIGHSDLLKEIGVPVRAQAPNLGERVIEQRGVALQEILKNKTRFIPALLASMGPSFFSTAGYDLVCQFKSSPGISRPDIQGLFVPMALDTSSTEMKLAWHPGILFMAYPMRPTTHSSVHSSGPSPADPPVIDARYLENEADRAAAGPVLDIARAVLGQGPVAGLIAGEEFPGPAIAGPEATAGYSLATGSGIYHAVGSAAMGPAATDVVDARLRVRGVSGLRIADASVLPAQVSGNTAAPAMAIGWRAADFILAGELRFSRSGRADQAVEDLVEDPVEVCRRDESLRRAAADRGGEPGVLARGEQFGDLRVLSGHGVVRPGGRGGGGLQFGADHVHGEAVDEGDRLQAVSGREPGGRESVKGELEEGEAGGPDRLQVGHGVDHPRMTVHEVALLVGDQVHVGAPVAARLGQVEFAADGLDHVVDEALLVRHVVVEGHDAGPESRRHRAEGHAIEAVFVADRDRGRDDRLAAVPWPGPAPALTFG
jgi:choline dehydrogenase-like flavoprotein